MSYIRNGKITSSEEYPFLVDGINPKEYPELVQFSTRNVSGAFAVDIERNVWFIASNVVRQINDLDDMLFVCCFGQTDDGHILHLMRSDYRFIKAVVNFELELQSTEVFTEVIQVTQNYILTDRGDVYDVSDSTPKLVNIRNVIKISESDRLIALKSNKSACAFGWDSVVIMENVRDIYPGVILLENGDVYSFAWPIPKFVTWTDHDITQMYTKDESVMMLRKSGTLVVFEYFKDGYGKTRSIFDVDLLEN